MPITPQELIANLGDLPPLPQVASQVLRVSADPDANAEDLRKVIATDQALTSQILKSPTRPCLAWCGKSPR